MRKKTLLLPFVYFAACFLAASAGYYIVGLVTFLIFGRAVVFGVPPHDVIPLYHYIHPFQYIAVVAFVYAWVASGWTLFRWHASNRWLRRAEILVVLIASVIVSLPLVSLLFSVHDMLAGFVPTFWEEKLVHDMHRTFSYALSILLNAIFFTVPGLFVGTALTNAIDRWYRTERLAPDDVV